MEGKNLNFDFQKKCLLFSIFVKNILCSEKNENFFHDTGKLNILIFRFFIEKYKKISQKY